MKLINKIETKKITYEGEYVVGTYDNTAGEEIEIEITPNLYVNFEKAKQINEELTEILKRVDELR